MPNFTCLTVCQPYAWAIAEGIKPIENRGWRIYHRGWQAIHAGKSRDYMCPVLNDGTPVPPESELVFGAIVCLVKVVNCLRPDDPRIRNNPFAKGPWCHIYDQVRKLARPIPWKGERGLFKVDIAEDAFCLANS